MRYSQTGYLIIVVMMLNSFLTRAQAKLSFKMVDSLSYALYENKSWLALSQLSDTIISAEMDYYYLRMRAGIANFELKKYRAAIPHFQKALVFNLQDELSKEYLKYCYLYTNRNEEQNSSNNLLSNKKCPLQLQFIQLESGIKTTSDTAFKNAMLSNFSVQHSFGKRGSLLHVINYYSQTEYRFKVSQLQYYLRWTYALKNNFKISLATHYIYDQDQYHLFASPPPSQGGSDPTIILQGVGVPRGALTSTSVASYNYSSLSSISILKQTPWLDFNLGATVSFLENTNLYQVNTGACFYPLLNNELQFNLQAQAYRYDLSNQNYFSFSPSITSKIFNNFYVTVAYFQNSSKGINIIEQNGLLFNNSVDLTLNRTSIIAFYSLNKHWSLSYTAAFENKTHVNNTFEFIKFGKSNFNYAYYIYLIGLKYKF